MKTFKNMTVRAKFNSAIAFVVLIFVGFAATAVFVEHIGIIIGAALVALGMMLIVLTDLMRNVSHPAEKLLESAKSLADGDFKNIVSYESDDEFGQLSSQLSQIANRLSKLPEANQSITSLQSELDNVSMHMEKFINGELASARMGFGKKSRHVATAFVLARTLHENVADMQGLAAAIAAGDFSKRLAAEKYGGDWQKLAHAMNKMADALAESIEQARSAMDAIAAGNLGVKISADARGELLKLKTSTNNATASLTKHVKTITHALENINKKPRLLADLPQDFAPIKMAIIEAGESMAKDRDGSARPAAIAPGPLSRRSAAANTSTTERQRDLQAHKKFSGALKLEGIQINTQGTPDYMKSDFGKY